MSIVQKGEKNHKREQENAEKNGHGVREIIRKQNEKGA